MLAQAKARKGHSDLESSICISYSYKPNYAA